MDAFIICMLVASFVWSFFCTTIVFRNEDTINCLIHKIKKLERENNKLNDHIRELLFPDDEPNDDVDWYNKDKN